MQARCPLVQYTFSEAHSTQQLFSLIDYDHRVDPTALFMWKMHHNHSLAFHSLHLIPMRSSKQSAGRSENTVQWLREDGVESSTCWRGSQRQLTGFNAQPAQTHNARRSIRDARTSSKTCEWRITGKNLTQYYVYRCTAKDEKKSCDCRRRRLCELKYLQRK